MILKLTLRITWEAEESESEDESESDEDDPDELEDELPLVEVELAVVEPDRDPVRFGGMMVRTLWYF